MVYNVLTEGTLTKSCISAPYSMSHPTYLPLSYPHLPVVGGPPPYVIYPPPNNRKSQRHYVTDEQCIHTPANMMTHCLRNNYLTLLIRYTLNTLLRRFPCGYKQVINIFIIA